MPGLLADIGISGQWKTIMRILGSDEWREIWSSLDYHVETFASLGLANNATDRLVWQTCQDKQLVLLTANRNKRGTDSLEATIQELNKQDSLPVITIANANRVRVEKSYADRAAERLLDYLMNIENYRGVGRLYVP